MFPLTFRAVALSKKPAAAASTWPLHRVSLLKPTSSSNIHHFHYHHKVNVSSTETIKPSSPTPAQLTTFKLSLIDNHVPPIYVPFIFFFPAPRNRGSNSIAGERIIFDTLKSSLAQTLTRFYPLAGRLSNINEPAGPVPVVHCNDEGVPFSSATVDGDIHDASVAQLLRGPRLEIDSLQKFLPFPAHLIITSDQIELAPQIAFRATAFPCGGHAIGVCLLHKIIDGITLTDFMKLWSAVARSQDKTAADGSGYAHNLAATSLLPLRHDDVTAVGAEDFVGKQGKMLTRRLTFDEEAVHGLKARAKSGRLPNPSRTEAVGGFLWKHVMGAAARSAASPDQPNPRSVVSVAAMMVNLRSRMNEPWPDYSVGNILWPALSLYHSNRQQDSLDDGTKMIQELVGKLRGSVVKLDKEFMRKLQGRDGRQEFLNNLEAFWMPTIMVDAAVKNETVIVPFMITSTIGLNLYDVDFGWGKPAWVSMAQFPSPVPYVAFLLESPVGYGVEVWLTVPEKEMAILEQEPEFVTYTKNNMHVL